MTRDQIKGLSYIGAIATFFGFWQQNVVAGFFMMGFLLFLEKMVRLLLESIADVADAFREEPEERDPVLEALQRDKSPGAAGRLNDYLVDNWKKGEE
jgi:hypothetical protein